MKVPWMVIPRSWQSRVIRFLQALGDPHVERERWRTGMKDGQLVVVGEWSDVVEAEPGGGSVDEPAARHERRGLREPRGIPERPDLAPCLIPRAGAAVETLEGRRMQKESLQHEAVLSLEYIRPSRPTDNRCPRQRTAEPRKLTAQTTTDAASRTGTNHGAR